MADVRSARRGTGAWVIGISRRWAGALALLCWLAAFYAAPLLHLHGHKNDHRHLAGGGITYFAAHDRLDDPAYWDESAPYWEDDPSPDPSAPSWLPARAAESTDPSHGRGAAAHFGLALTHAAQQARLGPPSGAPAGDPVSLAARRHPRLRARAHGARAPPALLG